LYVRRYLVENARGLLRPPSQPLNRAPGQVVQAHLRASAPADPLDCNGDIVLTDAGVQTRPSELQKIARKRAEQVRQLGRRLGHAISWS
jgi:hypothetical protein